MQKTLVSEEGSKRMEFLVAEQILLAIINVVWTVGLATILSEIALDSA